MFVSIVCACHLIHLLAKRTLCPYKINDPRLQIPDEIKENLKFIEALIDDIFRIISAVK